MENAVSTKLLENFQDSIRCFVPLTREAIFASIDHSIIQPSINVQIKHLCDKFFEADFDDSLAVCKILLDITWEKLNTGYWKDVNMNWRYLYYETSVLKVLCECALLKISDGRSYKGAIKTCDMGLLMGAPTQDGVSLTEIVKELHLLETGSCPVAPCKRRHSDGDEEENMYIKCVRDENNDPVDYIDLSGREVIQRVMCPSLEHFKKHYMDSATPVVVENAIHYWPALGSRKWTLDYIRNKAGHRTVPVEIGSKYTADEWSQSLMSINEFIDKHVLRSDNQKIGYLAQHQLFDQIPELEKDISIPAYCSLGECEDVDVNAWFGPRGTVSPLHQDPKHNLLAQVVGSKYVKMFSMDQTDCVYPYEGMMMSNTSQVDVERPDWGKFPRFKEARAVECVLKPGELLYIPPKYWHYLRSLSVSFSVSFWWE